jgi:transcriptional regulator with XRE-family HTH domain
MAERLTAEEVAILIRARQLLKAKGLSKDADVKTICEVAGVSRKTGYQWASKLTESSDDQEKNLAQELARFKGQYEDLKKLYERLDIENEGRKLAWEIHSVDELLAAKKNTTNKKKKRKR